MCSCSRTRRPGRSDRTAATTAAPLPVHCLPSCFGRDCRGYGRPAADRTCLQRPPATKLRLRCRVPGSRPEPLPIAHPPPASERRRKNSAARRANAGLRADLPQSARARRRVRAVSLRPPPRHASQHADHVHSCRGLPPSHPDSPASVANFRRLIRYRAETGRPRTRYDAALFFLPRCKLAYVPAANLVWNFSIRPAVSTYFNLPV